MICAKCKKDLGKLSLRDRNVRKLVLSPTIVGRLNPFSAVLPKEAKEWCGSCIREYLVWDQVDKPKSILTGVLIYKEVKE